MNPRILAAAAAVTTAIVTMAPTGIPLVSAATGDQSRIAWSQFDRSFSSARIMSADPNGQHSRKLTNPGPHAFDLDPVISPDGTQIAFNREQPDGFEVMLIDERGQDEHVVDLGCADPCDVDVAPSWTSDGQRIVFTRIVGPFDQVNDSARSAVLHTANPDGTDVQRLSEPGIDGAYEDYHARFAPDGSYLTFVRIRNADIKAAVFRMDADGSHIRQLTPWELDGDLPDLSPATHGATKDLVVFETFGHGAPDGKAQDIATVPATCTSLNDCASQTRYVTNNGAGPQQSFNPSWSPDGRSIAYVEFVAGDDSKPPTGDIWTVQPDGSHRRPVSTSPRFDFRPDWGHAN
jgi:Tol biopolymer transport system component